VQISDGKIASQKLAHELLPWKIGSQSVNEGFEIKENAEICRLKDLDFRVF
jgi:hypothetical protein